MKFHRTLTALFLAFALTLCLAPTAFASDEAPTQSGFILDLSWLTDGVANLWDAVISEPEPNPAPADGSGDGTSSPDGSGDGNATDETGGYVVPIG